MGCSAMTIFEWTELRWSALTQINYPQKGPTGMETDQYRESQLIGHA